MLELKLRRIGSSLGVLLPKKTLDERGLREGDTVLVPRISGRARRDLYGIWKTDPVRLEFQEEP